MYETPAPVSPPPQAAPVLPGAQKPSLLPIAAGAVVLIAIGLWLALHKTTPEPSPNTGDAKAAEVQDVKNFADQYLNYRDSATTPPLGRNTATVSTTETPNQPGKAKQTSATQSRRRRTARLSALPKQRARRLHMRLYSAFKDGSKYKNELRVVKNSSGPGWFIRYRKGHQQKTERG